MERVTSRLVRFVPTGADGRPDDAVELMGDLFEPDDPRGAAVVCHPHPLYGGTRRDAVVAVLVDALVVAGYRTLRFDFRGAGDSSGTHGGGRPELDDVRAALALVTGPGRSHDSDVVLAGYSFGADVALHLAGIAGIDRWIVVAPPLAVFGPTDPPALGDPRPVTVIAGEHDQFNPAAALRSRAGRAGWAATSIHAVEGADHFFAGHHGRIGELAAAALP